MTLSANIHGLEVPLPTLKSINMNMAIVETVMSWTATSDYYTLGVRIINCKGISKTVWYGNSSLVDTQLYIYHGRERSLAPKSNLV